MNTNYNQESQRTEGSIPKRPRRNPRDLAPGAALSFHPVSDYSELFLDINNLISNLINHPESTLLSSDIQCCLQECLKTNIKNAWSLKANLERSLAHLKGSESNMTPIVFSYLLDFLCINLPKFRLDQQSDLLCRISKCFSKLTHLDENVKESISPSVHNFAKFSLTFNLLNEVSEPIWKFLNDPQKEHLLSPDVQDTFDQTQLEIFLMMAPYSIKHFTLDAIRKLSCPFVYEISKQHPKILTTYLPDSLKYLQKSDETQAIKKLNQDDDPQIDTSSLPHWTTSTSSTLQEQEIDTIKTLAGLAQEFYSQGGAIKRSSTYSVLL